MRRGVVLVIICACVLPVSVAQAWTWPVDGPILRPFSFDRAHPYGAGQHRGVDLGAPTGSAVVAPAAGVVSFAGTVPTGGKTVSIQTSSGYTLTLVHLGSISVTRGATLGEGAVVGSVGPSGVVEHSDPYVYFGVRTTSDPQGYVDPMALLPTRATPPPPAAATPAKEAAVAPATSAPAVDTRPAEEPVPAAAVETPANGSVAAPAAAAPASVQAIHAEGPAAPALEPDSAHPALPRLRATSGKSAHVAGRASETRVGSNGRSTLAHDQAHKPANIPPSAIDWSAGAHHGEQRASWERVSARDATSRRGWLVPGVVLVLTLATLSAYAWRCASRRNPARIMSLPESEHVVGRDTVETEDPGSAGLADRKSVV